jgi:TonB family protein
MKAGIRVVTLSVALALPMAFAGSSFAHYNEEVSSAQKIPPRVNYACPTPAPDVPQSATLNEEKGAVYLNVLVSTRGRPKKIRVLRSSGFDDLDNAAVTAAATWHYIPAKMNQGPVTDWMALRMDFGVHENGTSLKTSAGASADGCGY